MQAHQIMIGESFRLAKVPAEKHPLNIGATYQRVLINGRFFLSSSLMAALEVGQDNVVLMDTNTEVISLGVRK